MIRFCSCIIFSLLIVMTSTHDVWSQKKWGKFGKKLLKELTDDKDTVKTEDKKEEKPAEAEDSIATPVETEVESPQTNDADTVISSTPDDSEPESKASPASTDNSAKDRDKAERAMYSIAGDMSSGDYSSVYHELSYDISRSYSSSSDFHKKAEAISGIADKYKFARIGKSKLAGSNKVIVTMKLKNGSVEFEMVREGSSWKCNSDPLEIR